jgi:hypothetical protein
MIKSTGAVFVSNEIIGSAIQRLSQEKAQARIELKRAETLIKELAGCFGRLAASLSPNPDNEDAENPEWVVANVDAELAVYLNIEKLRGLLRNRDGLKATIADCTSKINGYTGE